jgi:predicted 3-demethylubiquinone-9 3-methyltransferase (glyoxalase superfamily)
MDKVSTWLWSNFQAEEMARFYADVIPQTRIVEIAPAMSDYPGGKAGDIVTVELEMAGRTFGIINGGPGFPPTEATSLQILCEDQAEIDRLWAALSTDPKSEQCGWCKDKFGVSWQVVPRRLNELLAAPDKARARRVNQAMLGMKKLDIAKLEAA